MRILALATAITLGSALPAGAHTDDERLTWLDAWEHALADAGGLTDDLLAQYLDFADRHDLRGDKPTAVSVPTIRSNRTPPAGVEGWRDLVAAYFPAENVDAALVVLACESGGNPDAYNSSSGASGLFQHLARYWPARAADAGFPDASPFDAEANIAAAARLSAGGTNWSHWVCKP